MGQSHS